MPPWLSSLMETIRGVPRLGRRCFDRLTGRDFRRRIDQQAQALKWLIEQTPAPRESRTNRLATRPLISIVMPVWNRADVVRTAIDSVFSQTYPHWELIIVDDGSTDETRAVLEPLTSDPRVRLLTGSHSGVCRARNRALQVARGEIIAYLDSDNSWFPRYLDEVAFAFAAQPEVECVYAAQLVESSDSDEWSLRAIDFDRWQFQEKGGIDLNVFAHRRRLIDEFGGFDERLTRLVDWDLILRYTAQRDPVLLPTLGGRYAACRPDSISARERSWPNRRLIQQRRPRDPRQPLRVLYAVANYPQLTETYIRSEIATLRRWGVEIEVWSDDPEPRSPYPAEVPVHHGSLPDAIARFQPELLHVHWLSKGKRYCDIARQAGLPMTVRGHSFEFATRTVHKLAKHPAVGSIYLFPHFAKQLAEHPKIHAMTSAFNSEFFFPAEKNRSLVVRTGAGKPTKGLMSFLEIASRCPDHQFVLALGLLPNMDRFVGQLLERNRQLGSPVTIRQNLSNEEAAALVREAGIYLHTYGDEEPFGMPVSIAESLATGCFTLVRDLPGAAEYLGGAGELYRDVNDAVRCIQGTAKWSEFEWQAAQARVIKSANERLADGIVLRPLLDDWLMLTGRIRATLPITMVNSALDRKCA